MIATVLWDLLASEKWPARWPFCQPAEQSGARSREVLNLEAASEYLYPCVVEAMETMGRPGRSCGASQGRSQETDSEVFGNCQLKNPRGEQLTYFGSWIYLGKLHPPCGWARILPSRHHFLNLLLIFKLSPSVCFYSIHQISSHNIRYRWFCKTQGKIKINMIL